MPNSEKPREKGLKYGVSSLSTRELLALLIRCGVKGQSALVTADLLLQKAQGLKGIARLNIEELQSIRGLSKIKALELCAVVELARRMSQEEIIDQNILNNADSLVRYLRQKIGFSAQEEFVTIFLDNSYHFLGAKTIFIGTIDSSLVSPREVFREALLANAKYVVLAHNHPSGNLQPSHADIQMTESFIEVGKMMQVPVVDHFIITPYGYTSFLKEGIVVF